MSATNPNPTNPLPKPGQPPPPPQIPCDKAAPKGPQRDDLITKD
jgi:hypothetical protein